MGDKSGTEWNCSKCGDERSGANLVLLANGERVCPEHIYAKAAYALTHPKLAGRDPR